MTSPRIPAAPSSPVRVRLCSRENALRVAERLFERDERRIAVVRTGDPLQPFRVEPGEAKSGAVEIEIVCR